MKPASRVWHPILNPRSHLFISSSRSSPALASATRWQRVHGPRYNSSLAYERQPESSEIPIPRPQKQPEPTSNTRQTGEYYMFHNIYAIEELTCNKTQIE